jgi:hypothetical protein
MYSLIKDKCKHFFNRIQKGKEKGKYALCSKRKMLGFTSYRTNAKRLNVGQKKSPAVHRCKVGQN